MIAGLFKISLSPPALLVIVWYYYFEQSRSYLDVSGLFALTYESRGIHSAFGPKAPVFEAKLRSAGRRFILEKGYVHTFLRLTYTLKGVPVPTKGSKRCLNTLGPGPTVAVAGGAPLENGWGHGWGHAAAVRDARLIKPVWAGASHPVGDAAPPPSPPATNAVVPAEEERKEEGWRGEEDELRAEGKDARDQQSGDGGMDDDVFDMELMVSNGTAS
ncbi:hypothetical protein ElyMa_004830800 [Elysia marginata]|uniref:Uncharacterized protein n=1 Tax=Elysia marginata TaxID=1093978 RepID=A0AAV4INI7_9GAST|nr:hypothetical protein ElyMa_004830800 [Elysia marginata]